MTIDKQTGQIVNQVSAGKVGKGKSGGGATDSEIAQAYKDDAVATAQSGATLESLFSIYAGKPISPEEIFQIYNSVHYYNKPEDDANFKQTWTPEKLALYNVKLANASSAPTINVNTYKPDK